MNTNQAPLKPVIDLLERIQEGQVLQISGSPVFSVYAALNISSGLDTEHTIEEKPVSRFDKLKQLLGGDPQRNQLLNELDEYALTWAFNDNYFDKPLHPNSTTIAHSMAAPVRVWAPADTALPAINMAAENELNAFNPQKRLFVLFEQASFDLFSRINNPLRNTGLGDQQEATINTYGLDWPSRAIDLGTHLLRQSFAQTYAVALLMIASSNDERTQNVVENLKKLNNQKHSVWNGSHLVWDVGLGNSALINLQDTFEQWKKLPADQLKDFVLNSCGMQFGRWLTEQPFSSEILTDMIPTFDKRVMDLAHCIKTSENPLEKLSTNHPLRLLLSPVQGILQTQWKPHTPTAGPWSKIALVIHRMGLAMNWVHQNNTDVQHYAQAFNTALTNPLNQLVEQATIHSKVIVHKIKKSREKHNVSYDFSTPPVP